MMQLVLHLGTYFMVLTTLFTKRLNTETYPEQVKQGLLVFCFVSWYLFIYIAVQLF